MLTTESCAQQPWVFPGRLVVAGEGHQLDCKFELDRESFRFMYPSDWAGLRWSSLTASTSVGLEGIASAFEGQEKRECSFLLYVCDLSNLVTLYTQGGYGITGLRGTLKDKTKGLVSGHYSISGKLSGLEIQERVKFLMTQSNFCCGGINFEVRTLLTTVCAVPSKICPFTGPDC